MEQEIMKLLREMDRKVDGIASDVGILKSDVGTLKSDVCILKSDVEVLKADVSTLKESVRRIEFRLDHDIDPKINVLFDGYKQHTSQIDKLTAIADGMDRANMKLDILVVGFQNHEKRLNSLEQWRRSM